MKLPGNRLTFQIYLFGLFSRAFLSYFQWLELGAFGQRAKQTRGEVFIPALYAAQFGVRAAAKEGRKHYSDNLA
jgi:hypothetical protein